MSRLQDRRNAKRINGLRRDPRTGAGKLAKAERGYGGVLAFDFTDQSAAIYDPTTQANVSYTQGIADNGNMRGPGALLTYTSASNKICRQASGNWTYGAHNLITYSEALNSWNKNALTSVTDSAAVAPNGVAASLLVEDGTTNGHYSWIACVLVNGAEYEWSATVKGNGRTHAWLKLNHISGGPDVWFNLSTGLVGTTDSGITASMVSIGSDWYQITARGVSASANNSIIIGFSNADNSASWAGDSSSGGYVGGFQIYRYPANTDYIKTTSSAVYSLPYTHDVNGVCEGILVEEARTNLCLYSNDLTNAAWTKSNMTTANTATGPDGVANSATTITATAGNATVLQAITSASAARVTSVFIKRRTGTGNIDLTQDNGSTWTTQAVDSTWTRFSLSSVTSTNPTVGIRIVTSGDAVDVALFSHEVGSFVTSPIITYGSTATRAADQKAQLTSTFPLSATAGSLYAYVVPYAGSDLAGIVSLNDGSGNEEVVIYKDASANIVAQVEDGGANQLAPLDSTVNATSNTAFKVALAYAANDFALSADGTAAQTDTGGTLPTVTTLELGVDQANNYFNGIIKAISYVPRRKSDSELQTETT